MVSKKELVEYASDRTGLSKKTSSEVFDALKEAVTYFISRGEKVNVSDFGTFEVKIHSVRESYNVQTGQRMMIEESMVPVFRPSKHLKKAVRHCGEEKV